MYESLLLILLYVNGFGSDDLGVPYIIAGARMYS